MFNGHIKHFTKISFFRKQKKNYLISTKILLLEFLLIFFQKDVGCSKTEKKFSKNQIVVSWISSSMFNLVENPHHATTRDIMSSQACIWSSLYLVKSVSSQVYI